MTMATVAVLPSTELADPAKVARFRLLDAHRRARGSPAYRLAGRLLSEHGDDALHTLAVMEHRGEVDGRARTVRHLLEVAGVREALPLLVAIEVAECASP